MLFRQNFFIRDILSTFFQSVQTNSSKDNSFPTFQPEKTSYRINIVVSNNPENNVLRVYWHATVALSVIGVTSVKNYTEYKDSLTFLTRTNEIQSKPAIIIHAVPLHYYYRSSTVISTSFHQRRISFSPLMKRFHNVVSILPLTR